MNILEAKNEIKNTVSAYLLKDTNGKYIIDRIRQRPMLLIGPPGVGKTQIMEQVASECNIGLVAYTITHHTRQSAVGLPMIKEFEYEDEKFAITEYTMSEIIAGIYQAIKTEGKKEGILFIDEINCVSETLMPTMLQFLQKKTFGNKKIPEGWIIVAAGNPAEYNKSVREFDIVTLDRVRLINVEADLQVWKKYAVDNKVHGAILSYLDLRPAHFYKIYADVDGMQFVTARGWEDLSNLIKAYEKLNIAVNEALVAQFIQNADIALDFAAYYDLYYKYNDDYEIEDIVEGNVSKNIYERLIKASIDEKITVVNLILDNLYLKLENYAKSGENENLILLKQIDNCFNFIEENFDTTEMLIFVTGLTMNNSAVIFLAFNYCSKFVFYSDKLLNDKMRTDIIKELEA